MGRVCIACTRVASLHAPSGSAFTSCKFSLQGGNPPKVAVRGLDLGIRRGEVFGLLGPNGAGKTSAIHMMIGFLQPTAGEACPEIAPQNCTIGGARYCVRCPQLAGVQERKRLPASPQSAESDRLPHHCWTGL